MKCLSTFLTVLLGTALHCHADVTTIEQCVADAMDNYPLIAKYEVIKTTSDIDLEEINRSWLPGIGLFAQGTVQNTVPSFPESLSGLMSQMGNGVRGMGKLQYKAGAEITQNIWDGGMSRARRKAVRANEAVRKSALDVELYAVRERVENLYFAILLTEEQISCSNTTYTLLQQNLSRLRAMLENGVAMQSDVDMTEAEVLVLKQKISLAKSYVQGYRRMLGILTGKDISGDTLKLPEAVMPDNNLSDRPELTLFQNRISANLISDKITDAGLMPKAGLFAQGYYGYPGFNYFQSMINRNMSWNFMAGIKVSWSIDAFYTKKASSSRKIKANNADIAAEKELFLFNTKMKTADEEEAIDGLRKVISEDSRILSLRENVRKAAESQLENGVIDTTALLSKISEENIARLNSAYHEMQLIQEIYKLKYLLNK